MQLSGKVKQLPQCFFLVSTFHTVGQCIHFVKSFCNFNCVSRFCWLIGLIDWWLKMFLIGCLTIRAQTQNGKHQHQVYLQDKISHNFKSTWGLFICHLKQGWKLSLNLVKHFLLPCKSNFCRPVYIFESIRYFLKKFRNMNDNLIFKSAFQVFMKK